MSREEDSHNLRKRAGQAPPLQSCEKLLTGFELGGDQTNLVNAGAAHDIDGAGDIHEQYIVVAFDESDFLGPLLEDGLHARTEAVPSGVFVIDLELPVHVHLDDDGLVFKLDVLLLVRRRLRDERVQTLRRERGDDHENNDQHQQNVDERDDVGRRHRSAGFPSYIHPHSESPVGLRQSVSAGHETAPGGIRRGASKDQQTNGANRYYVRSSIRGRRRRTILLVFLGEQTELIDAGRANLIDDGDNFAVLRTSIALDVNGLVKAGGDAILDLTGEIFLGHLSVAKVDFAVAGDGDDDGVVLVRILHVPGVVGPHHVHRLALLQHGRDHHEDDQQHEHDVGHGNHVGGRHLGSGYWFVGHGRLLLGATAQDEVVDELHGGVVHLDVEGFYFIGEVVVSPDGGNGDEQAESGGDERFRDTAGDGRQTSGLVRLDAFKRVQDADDSAEETDERRGRTDGGEGREASLHFGVDDGDGALETALGGVDDVGVRDLLRGGLKLGEAGRHNLGDMALLIALRNGDGFVELAFLEGTGNLLNEDARLLARRAVHQRAVNHHAEGIDGKNEEDEDDC